MGRAVATVGWWDRTDRSVFADLRAAVVERFGDLRWLGPFQATLAHVPTGGLEGAIAPGPTLPWDTVAAVHMVRRAGGTVTDARGEECEPDVLVAWNGEEHAAVLEAARSPRAEY